jgi:hypothetical protein
MVLLLLKALDVKEDEGDSAVAMPVEETYKGGGNKFAKHMKKDGGSSAFGLTLAESAGATVFLHMFGKFVSSSFVGFLDRHGDCAVSI